MRIRTTLGVTAILIAAGTVFRIAREVAEVKAGEERLLSEWTSLRSSRSGRALRVHARAGGIGPADGPVAVLVHGYGVGSSYLVPYAVALADRMRVFVPDLPGHGRSDHDVQPLTIPELAEALVAWMDIRGLRAVTLVGHSLGCQVAAEAAARRPDLAGALVLIGPTSDPSARTIRQQLARGLLSSIFERPSYAVWGAIDYQRAGLRVLARELHEMMTHRIEDVLPRIGAPALVIRGARDRLVPQRWAAHVTALLGAPPPIVVPGWGHAVHYDEPRALAELTWQMPTRRSAPVPARA